MVKHCVTVIHKVFHTVSHRQILIITADQPLYALLKKINSKFSVQFGEGSFLIMMAVLRIEMFLFHAPGLFSYLLFDWNVNARKFWRRMLLDLQLTNVSVSIESNVLLTKCTHVTLT